MLPARLPIDASLAAKKRTDTAFAPVTTII